MHVYYIELLALISNMHGTTKHIWYQWCQCPNVIFLSLKACHVDRCLVVYISHSNFAQCFVFVSPWFFAVTWVLVIVLLASWNFSFFFHKVIHLYVYIHFEFERCIESMQCIFLDHWNPVCIIIQFWNTDMSMTDSMITNSSSYN